VPKGADQVPVEIWQSKLDAALADSAAHAWFSDLLGVSVRLVYLDDPTRRRPNPAYSAPGDRVSLADAYPLLLITEDSLAALNALMAVPLPMTRFRPSPVFRMIACHGLSGFDSGHGRGMSRWARMSRWVGVSRSRTSPLGV
jgi:MOSC domain-containing protein